MLSAQEGSILVIRRFIAIVLTATLAFPALSPAVGWAADASSAAARTQRRWIGFFQPQSPWDMASFRATEWDLRTDAKLISWYQIVPTTRYGAANPKFPTALAARAHSYGLVPMITLELGDPDRDKAHEPQPDWNLDAILSGRYDPMLRQYARDAAAFDKEVWLRPFHEMNGYWYPWGGTVNGNSPEKFKWAWIRVRTIFREQGADNVKFVWSPNRESVPATSANAIKKYWPGDAHVDYMGIDGFNYGKDSVKAYSWSRWMTFEELYAAPYREMTALSKKPIIVAETASHTKGGDKAKWIAGMFSVIPKKFPQIKAIVWFNYDKERNWRVASTSATRSAWLKGSSGSAWLNKIKTTATIKSSKYTTKRKKTFKLSGSLKGGETGVRVWLEVKRPKSTKWVRVGSRYLKGTTWSRSYTPKLKGTYRFRIRYFGSYVRTTATSRTIKVVVR